MFAAEGSSAEWTIEQARRCWKPKEIRIRLRSGDGKPLASVTVNGRPTPLQPGDVLLLPVQTEGTFRIIGRF